MPPAYSLEELVRSGAYRNARHRDLIAQSPTLPWRALAEVQSMMAATSHPLERDELSREFARRARALLDDEDEQQAREAEEAELESILHASPTEIADEEIGRGLTRWHDALLIRDLRGAGATWRQVAEQLDLSVGRARRLLAWLERPRQD